MKMNKKNILYLLILTIVSKYAFASPISPSVIGKSYNVTSVEENAIIINAAGNGIDPVGLLIGKFPPARQYHCTASMISTNNGNIALTAGHCLYDPKSKTYPVSLDFYPGFDRVQGTAGGGKIPVAKFATMPNLIPGNPTDDFGMIKLGFQGKLQDVTGSFTWNLKAPPKAQTDVFGYPENGNMPCKGPRDGLSFCSWNGQTVKTPVLRMIPRIDVGGGGSGGPWIMNLDRTAKKGTIIGVSSAYIPAAPGTAAATWNDKDFNDMLNYIEHA